VRVLNLRRENLLLKRLKRKIKMLKKSGLRLHHLRI
jgi:hypothetical protein